MPIVNSHPSDSDNHINILKKSGSRQPTTQKYELSGWCGVLSWLFLMIYGYDIFLLDIMAYFEGGSWLLFSFMLLYALCVALCGWFFGRDPDSLGKLALYTTPAAIMLTAILGLLPLTLAAVFYMLVAVLFAPVTTRRAYGIIHTANSGNRFFHYACGFAASWAAFALWLVIKPPKEIAFLFPALLAIPAWTGTSRSISMPDTVPEPVFGSGTVKPFFTGRHALILAAAIPVVFTVILMGRLILTSIFAGLGESPDPALDAILTWIPPAISVVLFGIINDKGYERVSFIVFIGLSMSGILLAFIPGATQGMILIPLIFAFCFGEIYAEFFVYTSPIYFVNSMRRPVFTASMGCVFYLIISALEWKKDFYLPHEYLTGAINIPALVTAAISTILFVIMVYFLFERYREKTLAAALYALLRGSAETPEPANQAASLFTPDERKIAMLLTEELHQHEIARKLHKTSGEVGVHIKAIREKVGISGETDPVISAVVLEYKLTRRETDMLRYLRRDITNAEIAAELFLSEGTIKLHVHNLLSKLKLENRLQLNDWLSGFASEKRIKN